MISILTKLVSKGCKVLLPGQRGFFSHRSNSSGVQVQHRDPVVVGVGHVKQLPTAADADPTGFVKEGLVESRAQSVTGFARPC